MTWRYTSKISITHDCDLRPMTEFAICLHDFRPLKSRDVWSCRSCTCILSLMRFVRSIVQRLEEIQNGQNTVCSKLTPSAIPISVFQHQRRTAMQLFTTRCNGTGFINVSAVLGPSSLKPFLLFPLIDADSPEKLDEFRFTIRMTFPLMKS